MKDKLNYVITLIVFVFSCSFEIVSANLEYFNLEEQLYIDSLSAKVKDVDQENNDLVLLDKIIHYELSVYGEYFGSDSIKKTADCYFLLKARKVEDDATFLLMDKFLTLWDRKTAMVLAHHYNDLSEDHKVMADELCSKIEGKDKWLLLKNDKQYLACAKYWCEIGDLSNVDAAEIKSIAVKMEKIKITSKDTKIDFALDDTRTISFSNGRVLINQGKLSQLQGGIYTGNKQDWLSNTRWSETVLSGRGFGGEILAWKDGGEGGMVQVLRARKTKTEREIILLKYKGHKRPWLGNVLNEFSADDSKMMHMRGAIAVFDDVKKQIDYEDIKKLCKFGSRLSFKQTLEKVRELNGDVKKMEYYLMMFAKKLPLMDKEKNLFNDYNEIIRAYK